MLTKTFARALMERSLSTFVQAFLGVLVALAAPHVAAGRGVESLPWLTVLSAALMAAVLAVAKGVLAALGDGNPSIGSPEVLSEPGATADPVGGEPVEVEPQIVDADHDGRDDNTGRFVPRS